MGAELHCSATVAGVDDVGRALLETNELLFRGEHGRVVIKLDAARAKASVRGPWLTVAQLSLKLGAPTARAWLERIQNPKSVATKLGLKPGQTAVVKGDEALKAFLEEHGVRLLSKPSADSVFFIAVSKPAQLAALPTLGPKNVLWLLRPKGPTSPVPESRTREAARAAGLVDVKVVSFSETHSAEKYVLRRTPR